MGKLYYIMGKSATGKDHIYRDLLSDQTLGLLPFVIYTTRPMRRGEEDGREYYFTTAETLETLRAAGHVIEDRVYQTINGPWHYATVDDGRTDLDAHDYLAIGTLESFIKLRAYYGAERVVPLYIETEDSLRLEHAIRRERKQSVPNYNELCRRFLADSEDFSEEKLLAAGVTERIPNNQTLASCIDAVRKKIIARADAGTDL